MTADELIAANARLDVGKRMYDKIKGYTCLLNFLNDKKYKLTAMDGFEEDGYMTIKLRQIDPVERDVVFDRTIGFDDVQDAFEDALLTSLEKVLDETKLAFDEL